MAGQKVWLIAFIAIVLVTIALLPFASELPDGLERVAEMFGFAERERQIYSAPLKDYALPGFGGFWGQAVAAVVGISVASGLAWLLATKIKKVKRNDA
ncbi:MAG: PDGLE domain-containing protein [Armatimonadetes bacterium]|nr:PDGLE domain-containing protein [Armatimonadota bacterium]MCX7969468.1 PDGLE domain-containing protein [Armatimonadota bacterium]MDW8143917.1 PDGLE domain-containing protein [Armatimonadota bacterium]